MLNLPQINKNSLGIFFWWFQNIVVNLWNKRGDNIMKYIFRGHTIFEYNPDVKFDKVIQPKIHDVIPAFDYCNMIPEDYKLLAEFFDKVYRHIQGEDVTLENIEVY
jgi:hypothetical protein